MDILTYEETNLEKQHTNKIRRQALLDANRELGTFIETTSQSQVKWWYEQAKKNNEDRKKLYS